MQTSTGLNKEDLMKTFPLLFTSCLALSVGLSAAVAATATSGSSSTGVAGKDYAKLSIDGAQAFQDVDLARLAIFDGKPTMAVKLVSDAQAAMSRAENDNTVFMKAEADLKTSKTSTGAAATPAAGSDAATKIAWVPIDGELTLDETLAPTPERNAAVAEANDHLRRGEPDKAHAVLKVASVTADYTLAVAPLDQSTTDIAQASKLLASKDYYRASQALRQAQDGVRYDTTVMHDIGGQPSVVPAKSASSG